MSLYNTLLECEVSRVWPLFKAVQTSRNKKVATRWFKCTSSFFFSSFPKHHIIHPDQFSFCQFGQRMKLSRKPNNINPARLDLYLCSIWNPNSGSRRILRPHFTEYVSFIFSTQFLSLHRRDLFSLWSQCCGKKKSPHCSRILTFSPYYLWIARLFPTFMSRQYCLSALTVNVLRLSGSGWHPIWFVALSKIWQAKQDTNRIIRQCTQSLSVSWGQSRVHNHIDKHWAL